MKTHVLKGSKQEIAERLVRITGEVHEAIVFEVEPGPEATEAVADDTKNIFAEMGPFMVDVPDVDDSREAIYARLDGE